MKKILLAFVLFLFAQSIFAQSISIDSSFSEDGRVETGMAPTESLSKFTTIQPDGKYILTGQIEPNSSHCSMKRYYPDGTLDATFQFNNTDLYIYAICLQDDGKIICATYTGLTRLHSNGQLDTSFVTSQVTQLANYYHLETRILPNGKIVSCGFKTNPTNDGIYVAVFNPDGTPDTNFAQGGIFKYHPTAMDLVFSLKTQQDGKIVFSGCSMVDDEAFITLYRLTDKGILDADFGVNGVILESLLGAGEGFEMDIQADGKIVVAGYLFTQNSSKACVLRYLPNGTRDPDFGVNGVCIIPGVTTTHGILIRPNGEIIVNGINKNDARGALIQLKPDGTLDLAFGENGIFYTSLENEVHSTMSIHGMESNKIIVSNGLYATFGTILNRYILDLSIGTLNPQDNSEKEWLIYPNPIANDFTLNFSLVATESISIALFDMNGKFIKSLTQDKRFDVGAHEETYRLGQEMPAGNYLLTISMRGKPVSSVQIIKK